MKAEKTAILVVDMLNDFVTGALKCDRGLAIVPNVKRLLDGAREKNVAVIFCNDAHIKGVDHELKLWGDHAIAGTYGAEVIPELGLCDSDYVVPKRRYSGFFRTDLELLLREPGIEKGIKNILRSVYAEPAEAFLEECSLSITKFLTDPRYYLDDIYGEITALQEEYGMEDNGEAFAVFAEAINLLEVNSVNAKRLYDCFMYENEDSCLADAIYNSFYEYLSAEQKSKFEQKVKRIFDKFFWEDWNFSSEY